LAAVAAKPEPVNSAFLREGNPRPILHAAVKAARDHGTGVLALVLETEGSTYSREGAMAFFDDATQVGWLSGGCLEPVLARRALDAENTGLVQWVEIDTRADEDLLTGSALGCRGRLRVALVPLRAMPDFDSVFDAWLRGQTTLEWNVRADGFVALSTDDVRNEWELPTLLPEWASADAIWSPGLARPPEVMLLGAGPESPLLLRLLRELGWRTTLVERRPRWRMPNECVDIHFDTTPSAALTRDANADVALVMHHDFELDREALDALSALPIEFVGLLGPRHRRDDLFKLLSPNQRSSLQSRLRSPVGMALGGTGPEAIALSIAAQLQAWRAGAAQ